MQQLKKRMLAVAAGAAPDDRIARVIECLAVTVDGLAVTFHLQLLQIGRQLSERMAVGKYATAGGAEKVRVPDGQQGEGQGQVAGVGGREEMFIHRPGAGQELAEMLETHRQR